jgi:Tol biopolymer transport system component
MIRTTLIAIAVAVLMALGPKDHVASAQAPGEAESGLGSRIIFASTQHVIPEPAGFLTPSLQLYVMNADGSEQRQLTDFLGVKLMAACSPDGRQIAFQIGPPFNGIFLMNADSFVGPTGEGLTKIVSNGLSPRWSPNGKKIAFQSRPPLRDVFVLDLPTMELTNLTNDPNDPSDDAWDDYRPDWSPDGQKIAFTSNRDGNPEIYVMNADGSDPRRLTFSNGATSAAPHWSPNGKQIVFSGNRDLYPAFPIPEGPGSEIYVVNADGTGLTRLTDNLALDWNAAWSPNGKQIVFASDRDVATKQQVYVMNADGSDQRPLTGQPGQSSFADWCHGHANP